MEITPPKGEKAPQNLEYYKDMMAKDAVEMQKLQALYQEERTRSARFYQKLMKSRRIVGELKCELVYANRTIDDLRNER